jgi:GNAT superfamily N-acetyltransferase
VPLIRDGGPVGKGAAKLSSVELRRAVPGDENEVAEVHVRSWQVAYHGLLPAAYLDALRPADRAARYSFADVDPDAPETTVAVDRDTICGFAAVGPHRGSDTDGTGEIYAIYVHPDWWHLGVGRRLIGKARERLIARGSSDAILWVLVGNERAERFYRLDGWTNTGRTRREEVHGLTVDEVQYRRPLP